MTTNRQAVRVTINVVVGLRDGDDVADVTEQLLEAAAGTLWHVTAAFDSVGEVADDETVVEVNEVETAEQLIQFFDGGRSSKLSFEL